MNLRPMNHNVLLKLDEAPGKTKGGLFIPDNLKERPQRARVVAVGPQVDSLKPNDGVIFLKFAGTELTIDEHPHLLLSEEHILGVVEE